MSVESQFGGLHPRHYGAILADPPWNFATWSAKGGGRSALRHYQTQGFDKLAALPVGDLARNDAILFLWITDPQLRLAFALIEAWGFTYKTVGFTWVKSTLSGIGWAMGCGYYTRANPEMCLLATRGKPKRLSRGVRQLIIGPRPEHSRKPEEVRERIEQLAAGPYCDLFSRESRPGWDCWGGRYGSNQSPNGLRGSVHFRYWARTLPTMAGDTRCHCRC